MVRYIKQAREACDGCGKKFRVSSMWARTDPDGEDPLGILELLCRGCAKETGLGLPLEPSVVVRDIRDAL